MNLKCLNETVKSCKGEFVLTILDSCYFFYKTYKTYYNRDTNDLCLKKNLTEVDFRSESAVNIFFYLTMVIYKETAIVNNEIIPWKYFSEFVLQKNTFFLFSY